MSARLKRALIASLLISVLVNTGMLTGALYAAYQWQWLHPAVATTVVIFAGIGLTLALVHTAWVVGDRVEPYRGEFF